MKTNQRKNAIKVYDQNFLLFERILLAMEDK